MATSTCTREGRRREQRASNVTHTYLTLAAPAGITEREPPRQLNVYQNHSGQLRKVLVSSSEVLKCGHRGSSLDYGDHSRLSCPELGSVPSCPRRENAHSTESFRSLRERNTFPHSTTPTSLRSRLAQRFHRSCSWKSQHRSSWPSLANSAPESGGGDQAWFPTGKERRRMARESERHRNIPDEETPPAYSVPKEEEGTRCLAMAGVVLATADLDRLSFMARAKEENAEGKAAQLC